MKLLIGNKNYSSWSLRPWLLMRALDIAFDEVQIWLDEPAPANLEQLRHSPSAKVPCLIDGDYTVWDSLAIVEYLAERYPNLGVWPSQPKDRARARSVCAEMHSGFGELRQALPMNVRKRFANVPLNEKVRADIARIGLIWRDCLLESGGPFLFGSFSAADAFYAPVAWRFRSYGVSLEASLEEYLDRLLALPAMQEWKAASEQEGHALPAYDNLYSAAD
jgi:glutathione S-transferase